MPKVSLPLSYTQATLFNNVTSGAVLTSAVIDVRNYESLIFRLTTITQTAVGAVASMNCLGGFETGGAMSAFSYFLGTAATVAPTSSFGVATGSTLYFTLAPDAFPIRFLRFDVTSITNLGLELTYRARTRDA